MTRDRAELLPTDLTTPERSLAVCSCTARSVMTVETQRLIWKMLCDSTPISLAIVIWSYHGSVNLGRHDCAALVPEHPRQEPRQDWLTQFLLSSPGVPRVEPVEAPRPSVPLTRPGRTSCRPADVVRSRSRSRSRSPMRVEPVEAPQGPSVPLTRPGTSVRPADMSRSRSRSRTPTRMEPEEVQGPSPLTRTGRTSCRPADVTRLRSRSRSRSPATERRRQRTDALVQQRVRSRAIARGKADARNSARRGEPPSDAFALMVGHRSKHRSKYALVADGAEQITFIVDSGSSHHIFRGRKDLMQDYVNLSTSVSTANNVNGLRAVGHGTLPVFVTDVEGNEVRVDLKHVLHAPLCTHNLLSVARFTDMKMHVEFVGDTCTLHTPKGEQFEATRPQNLFELTARAVLSSEQAIALRVDDDVLAEAMTLHQSLGHRHWKKIKEVLRAGGVPNLKPSIAAELLKLPTLNNIMCKSCTHGKTTLRSLPKAAAPRTYQPFGLVSMDHCGPFPSQFGGFTHLAVCIEQSQRCAFIAPGNHPTGARSAEILAHLDNTARQWQWHTHDSY